MERPVLVYEPFRDLWTKTLNHNITSFISYQNANDIIDILLKIMESDTYYSELCKAATNTAKWIRRENKKNLNKHFEDKMRKNQIKSQM